MRNLIRYTFQQRVAEIDSTTNSFIYVGHMPKHSVLITLSTEKKE